MLTLANSRLQEYGYYFSICTFLHILIKNNYNLAMKVMKGATLKSILSKGSLALPEPLVTTEDGAGFPRLPL